MEPCLAAIRRPRTHAQHNPTDFRVDVPYSLRYTSTRRLGDVWDDPLSAGER